MARVIAALLMLDVRKAGLDHRNGIKTKRNGRYGAHSMTDRKHG
jgi:hypothetical protein